jgi:hypothetical protein
MGMETRTAQLDKLTNVELHEAFARVARQHPDQWDHPRRVALREEMRRRTFAEGRTFRS